MTNYNTQIQAQKAKMVALFKAKFNKALQESEMLRAQFGAGFETPTGIAYDVPENQKYLADFDSAKLKLEDPDAYLKLLKGNMDKLKKAMEAQHKEIIGGGRGGNGLMAHIKTVERNYEQAKSKLENMAEQCGAKVAELKRYENEMMRKMAEDQMKQQKEDQKLSQEVCDDLEMFATGGEAACSGKTGEHAANLARVASQLGVRDSYAELRRSCATIDPEGENGTSNVEKKFIIEAGTLCRKPEKKNTEDCKELAACLGPKTVTGKGDDREVSGSCEVSGQVILAQAILGRNVYASTSKPQSDIGEQPIATCSSRDRSGRGFDPSYMNGGFQGIAGGPAGIAR